MKPTTSIALLLSVSVGAAALRAETYRFAPQTFVTTFSASHAPVLRLKSGDRVSTATADLSSAGTDRASMATAPAQTGPFFVEGAEPGDLLVVTIERLEPKLAVGYSTSIVSSHAVPPAALSSRRPDTSRYAWSIDKARGVVRLDLQAAMPNVNWRTRFEAPAFEIPLRPTLGSIAVAPAGEDAASAAVGAFGGTITAAGVGAGARVMLPVFRPGALLFLGNGLANKGDGAVTGTGIETALEVDFSVEVVKRKEWPHSSVVRGSTVVGEFPMGAPRVETGDYLMAIGSGPSLEQALRHATIELHHWLDDDFGLNERSVSVLMGQALEYEVANLAAPHVTVVAKVRRSYLPRTTSAP